MEAEAMTAAFEWINHKNNNRIVNEAGGIKIITDSQNIMNILSQQVIPKDDVILRTLKDMEQEIQTIQNQQLDMDFVEIYWAKSHHNSILNNNVDIQAKIAADHIKQNHPIYDRTKLQNPNQFIAYNSIKSEVNHRTKKYDENIWIEFKKSKKQDYGAQY